MTQDHTQVVSRSAALFLSGTFLSRCTGMFRDIAMACCFGSHPAVAAFMVAFRFANLFRRLFGEGSLPASFIPHFESLRALEPERGAHFFRDLFFSLAAFLFLLIGAAELGLGGLLKWDIISADNAEIFSLTLLMLPGILFICLFGLSSALLQCEKKFFLSGFAPVAFNIVWIGAVFWLKDLPAVEAMRGLSLAIIAAFFMQWLVTAPGTWRFLAQTLSWKQLFRAKLFSLEIRQLVRPLLLSVIGVGAVQINSALDGLFARFASLEGPAYLWYAIRLEQLPLAVFGIALSSALLPPLSRAIQNQEWGQYQELLAFGLRRSFSLIMPCTLALLVLGAAGVNFLYGRGDFSQTATYETVICLWGYALGLIPSVFVLLLAPAFYAQKNYRTPTLASLYAVLLNAGLNALMVFAFHWGAFSIAVATSISAFFNCWYLSKALSAKTGPIFNLALLRSFTKTALCTLSAAVLTLGLGHFFFRDPTWKILTGMQTVTFVRELSQQALQCIGMGGVFGLLFFSFAWVLNAAEVLQLFGLKKK